MVYWYGSKFSNGCLGWREESVHFEEVHGQGATMSLPIWGLFMKKCYEDEELQVSKEDFEEPSSFC